MKMVMFDLVQSGNMIVYPDDKTLFKKTNIDNGYTPNKVYGEYYGSMDLDLYTPSSVPFKEYITLEWLRKEMTETYESQCRAYGLNSTNARYIEVQVFMDMVRDRINDSLIVSDPGYKAGILLIEDVGIFDAQKADEMLAVGGHSR